MILPEASSVATGTKSPGVDSEVVQEVYDAARGILAGGRAPDAGEAQAAFEAATAQAINLCNVHRLQSGQAPLDAGGLAALKQRVVSRLAGLGAFGPLLADPTVEDLWAVGCDNVWVTRFDGTREQVEPIADSDEELTEAIGILAAGAGISDTERRFDRGAYALNLQLMDGSRLHALRDVANRVCVSIRRHRYPEASLTQLQANGLCSPEIAALLEAAVAAKFNLILAGRTGSGKTTLLRALAGLCDPAERIVTIEDNYELGLHTDSRHHNVAALQVREPNIEGAGGVSAADLFRETLRMNPDRIILGEARGPEVAVMFDAMSNGSDGSLSTIHTSTSAGVFTKLKTYARKPPAGYEPEATAELVGGSLDLVVQLSQAGDRRWISSVREVCGSEGAMVVSNELYAPTGPNKEAQFSTPLTAARAEILAAHGWQQPGIPRTW